jgi:hypothetical protein
VEERKESKTYTIYNCDANNKITTENIAQVLSEALSAAQQLNAVIRLFRIIEIAPGYSVSLTVTRGGLITFDVRFPPRVGGYQNVLTVRLNEIAMLKMIVDKLVELVSKLTI